MTDLPICRDCRTPQPPDHACPERGRQDAIEAAGRILAHAHVPARKSA